MCNFNLTSFVILYNSFIKIKWDKFFPRYLLLIRTIFFVFTIVSLLMASLAHAGVRHIPIEEIFIRADFIVRGTVIDSKSHWDDKGIMIFTDYTIQVSENIKGNSTSHIVMSFAGGTVGNKSIFVTETPTLKVEEEYIICGYNTEKKYAVPVVGNSQGIFRIIHDEVKNIDIIVDYDWYQLEITDDQKILRGLPIQKDISGSVTVREEFKATKKEPPFPPIVRDASGNIIPQENRIFKSQEIRLTGKPLTKTKFIDFIKNKLTYDSSITKD